MPSISDLSSCSLPQSVQNSLVELFNLLTLLKPGLLQTEAAFKKEYVDSRNGRVPKNPEKLRSLMREVMVRNTRALVDVKLPKRGYQYSLQSSSTPRQPPHTRISLL